jgi:Mrr N-terminal domain
VSHHVEVDDEVFDYLQSRAQPFIDTPNSVLRRVLGMTEGTTMTSAITAVAADDDRPKGRSIQGGRQAALPMTPQRDFRPVIRAILLEAGGGREMSEVLQEVELRMRTKFREGDLAAVSTGEVRWRNAARWERMQMAKEGLIRTGTRAGWWELTEDGESA